jgi:hypothetical protein
VITHIDSDRSYVMSCSMDIEKCSSSANRNVERLPIPLEKERSLRIKGVTP